MYVAVYTHVTQVYMLYIYSVGKSLMVISTMGILLYAKVAPLYNVLWECIVVVYT